MWGRGSALGPRPCAPVMLGSAGTQPHFLMAWSLPGQMGAQRKGLAACCLWWEGAGVVRDSWRRFRSWRCEGSQVDRGRRSRTPHPGAEWTSAGSRGPPHVPGGGTPHLPLGPRLRVGLGGEHQSQGRQLASPKGGGVGSLAQGPLLSSGSGPCTWWPGAQGNRVLQGLGAWVSVRQWRWR